MRRLIERSVILLVMVGALAVARQARAEMAPGEHKRGGLGFHNTEAPVGVRWWLSGEKVGIDLGLGFESTPSDIFDDENLMSWGLDVGVPFVLHSWERMHVLFRPGLLYQSQEVESTAPPEAFDTENLTTLNLAAEIEAEVFLADNVSVSASHGLRWRSINPPGSGDNLTSFGTIGRNFTNVGFHVYFMGQ
jgi:hypothetical protein